MACGLWEEGGSATRSARARHEAYMSSSVRSLLGSLQIYHPIAGTILPHPKSLPSPNAYGFQSPILFPTPRRASTEASQLKKLHKPAVWWPQVPRDGRSKPFRRSPGGPSSEPQKPLSTTGDPRIIHKKSGEVVASVLRPPRHKLVRNLSGPPKSVHFNAHVDVRNFMRPDRPTAISAEPCLGCGRRVSTPSLHLDILMPRNPRPGPPVRL